ncbi:hypothetical protein HCJ46_17035 [Listeria booriae]|uniref:hypothetical protein n=1 Tax=Listeria booriae TaxID=1552123 RepID=UPI00162545D8|nr:hypothetical protein [Listeria booriae]MBC1920458.1 hypothetical protein [Listeria booriae]
MNLVNYHTKSYKVKWLKQMDYMDLLNDGYMIYTFSGGTYINLSDGFCFDQKLRKTVSLTDIKEDIRNVRNKQLIIIAKRKHKQQALHYVQFVRK